MTESTEIRGLSHSREENGESMRDLGQQLEKEVAELEAVDHEAMSAAGCTEVPSEPPSLVDLLLTHSALCLCDTPAPIHVQDGRVNERIPDHRQNRCSKLVSMPHPPDR